jgi:hypothetical protein
VRSAESDQERRCPDAGTGVCALSNIRIAGVRQSRCCALRIWVPLPTTSRGSCDPAALSQRCSTAGFATRTGAPVAKAAIASGIPP